VTPEYIECGHADPQNPTLTLKMEPACPFETLVPCTCPHAVTSLNTGCREKFKLLLTPTSEVRSGILPSVTGCVLPKIWTP